MSQKMDRTKKSENTGIIVNPKLGFINFILTPEQRKILETRTNLVTLYDTYKRNYLKLYMKHLEEENECLKQEFKNVDFCIMSRMKSKNNYMEKLRKKGEALDIFADKIIIFSVDGKTDEDLLIQTAYNMQNFLVIYNENVTEISRKRKDYIANPKANGYSSLHMTRTVYLEDEDASFNHETQIKTFRMREVEKSGTAGHSSVYKSNRDSLLRKINNKNSAEFFLPQYMHFVFDKTSRKDKIALYNFEENFKYYFHMSFEEFMIMRSIHSRED